MHFRRFIIDFSVITPNWIVKFQYVDEKIRSFIWYKNLDKFEVSQCCEKVIKYAPLKVSVQIIFGFSHQTCDFCIKRKPIFFSLPLVTFRPNRCCFWKIWECISSKIYNISSDRNCITYTYEKVKINTSVQV